MSTANFEEGFDDPSDFKAIQLSTLDEHLRCPICKEIFNATMILSTCSHSFCALCIRRSLSAEQICPKCRKPAYENHLIHNYDLDNVVHSWRESRQFLLSMETMATAPKQNINIQQQQQQQQPVQTSNSAPIIIDNDPTDDFMPSSNLKRAASASNIPSSTRRSTRLSSSQTKTSVSSMGDPMQTSQSDLSIIESSSPIQSSQTATIPEKLDTTMVDCPVCGQKMQYNVLDATHLNRCLNGDSSIPPRTDPISSTAFGSTSSSFAFNSPSSSSMPMMKVPKTFKTNNKPPDLGKKPIKQVYALMKDKDLTSLLRSFKLPEGGDRSQKIWRHKEYINLYNANYDAQNPVSAQVLVQRLQAIENSQTMEKYNQSKRKATDPSQHKAMYADQFQSLINDVKRKKVKNEDGTPKDH